MNNIVIPGLYSNVFACDVYYKQDINDIDGLLDIITYHLVDSCGNNLIFYLYATGIVVKTKESMWIHDICQAFSLIQKDLSEYINSPLSLSTGHVITDVPHWEVVVRHGAIETKIKNNY